MPALEVTGLYTLCPETGPTTALVPIQKQAITLYNESSILLAIHPAAIASAAPTTADGKLPISVYEGIIEADPSKEDGSMQVDGEASSLLFRNIPYSVDTDETEMIAINYVAKGAGNAAAAEGAKREISPGAAERAEKKGKKKADSSLDTKPPITDGTKDSSSMLAPEEEDQIAGLTTRLNSVRMLQSRLSLLSKFLQQQPPSHLTDSSIPLTASAPDPAQLPHLRNIQALLTRLNLLTPKASSTTSDTFPSAMIAQSNDVQLSQLLSLLGQDIQGMGEMGRKFATVEGAKQSKKGVKGAGAFMMGHGQNDSFGHEMDWHQDMRQQGGFSMAPF
jgi:COP9 signalosome complex subunit 6